MSKKKNEVVEPEATIPSNDQNDNVQKETTVETPETEFKPEVVGDGAVREEKKETPMDLVEKTVKKKKQGNWKVVSHSELVELEAKGLLVGYDPEKKEALIK